MRFLPIQFIQFKIIGYFRPLLQLKNTYNHCMIKKF